METKKQEIEDAPLNAATLDDDDNNTSSLELVLSVSNTLQKIKEKEELAQEQASFTLTEDEIEAAELERLLDQFNDDDD